MSFYREISKLKEVPGQISDLSRVEKNAQQMRKHALREALSHFATLYINTGKREKAMAIIRLISDLTGENLVLGNGVELIIDKHDEPTYVKADGVAVVKAKRAQVQAAKKKGYLLPGEVVSVGGDVNAFLQKPDGSYTQQHKLERDNVEISPAQFLKISEQLIQQYCEPENNQVRIIWDLATHIINGAEYTFGDDIEVISAPVDKELLEMYLWEAWKEGNKNGLMMKSNLHFAAMECLIENARIHSIAILPEELKIKGYGYKDMRQGPAPDILAVAWYSIFTNKPPELVGNVPDLINLK